jgi:hypothetical protein
MRLFRTSALAIAVIALSVSATLAQTKSKIIYGLSIPDWVGSLVYKETVDFESKSPGLGYALRFSGQPGWLVDVYLYDVGLKSIPSDIESDVVKAQFAQAKGDVFELGKRGTYADVKDAGDFTVPATGKPRFVCTSFSYKRGDRIDVEVDSFLCLTAWNNKFVKLRMTGPKGSISRSDANLFATAWISLLKP